MSNAGGPLVCVVMGSKNDWETMSRAHEVLEEFGVPHACRVLSAHRTPDELAAWVRENEEAGCERSEEHTSELQSPWNTP